MKKTQWSDFRYVALIVLSVAVTACRLYEPSPSHDTGQEVKDFQGLLNRSPPAEVQPQDRGPPIPQFSPGLPPPPVQEPADTRRVSVALTEANSVRDVLIEVTRKSGVDLELDQRVSGGIIYKATDRPFKEVVDRICDLAELRCTFVRNSLRVQIDAPYLEEYRLDLLNVVRNASSQASSSTDAASAAQAIGAGGRGGGSNKSATSIDGTSRSDQWTVITQAVQAIVQSVRSKRIVPPQVQPASATEQATASQAPSGSDKSAGSTSALKPNGLSPSTAPTAAGSAAPSGVSVNAAAGIMSVFATQRQHAAVQRYLREVQRSVRRQVLIEAKILEVKLSDQYRAGINWNAVAGGGASFVGNFARGVLNADFPNPTVKIIGGSNDNSLNYAASLVNHFGTVRTLSNPRLVALNNQVAVLKVASNQVFFALTATTTDATATTKGRTTVTSQIKTVPIGLIMSVQPAVDPVTQRISLSLRPSLTRVTGYAQDPGVQVTVAQFNAANPSRALNLSSPIPIVETREMDSVVSMLSGETVVLGGLMQESTKSSREGLPGIMDVPHIGQAAASNTRETTVTELVIFLRATVVRQNESVSDEDMRLYKTFTPDPRPARF